MNSRVLGSVGGGKTLLELLVLGLDLGSLGSQSLTIRLAYS